MKALIVACGLLLCAGFARADIIGWQDAQGVRHYTNLKADVPAEQQAASRVVVNELARQAPTATESQAAPPPQAATEAPREAEVVYDRSGVSRSYLAGLQRGLEAARNYATGGTVQITGPLAVASAPSTIPTYGYGWPYYYPPLVTTSFDRGRSRHLTLRLLLQDQFAIDREGPYVYEERLIPPFGHPPLPLNLNPFLPRGLPHGFPRYTRVIVR